MTDINTELETFANEEFVEEEQLAEIAADAPTKGAGPAMKPEKLPGEVQDMGPAVVSPDATRSRRRRDEESEEGHTTW